MKNAEAEAEALAIIKEFFIGKGFIENLENADATLFIRSDREYEWYMSIYILDDTSIYTKFVLMRQGSDDQLFKHESFYSTLLATAFDLVNNWEKIIKELERRFDIERKASIIPIFQEKERTLAKLYRLLP